MTVSTKSTSCSNDLMNSKTQLTGPAKETWKEKTKRILKKGKYLLTETTVEPCLFSFMLCTAISSLAVQNMHLEKACRVNFNFGDEICDRISVRNMTGLESEVKDIQSLVAHVMAWKFPLQTGIPAVMVLFVGAWSDKYKRRKICIMIPFTGEIITNVGLLLATYFFKEVSLTATVLIEALPAAFSGSYIIIFMGMYSFMVDRTTEENRTFRLGLVTICVTAGTPAGTAVSGILLKALGYYGVFTLLLFLHSLSFLYALFKLEDVFPTDEVKNDLIDVKNKCCGIISDVFKLVGNTAMVILKPREYYGRAQIYCILLLYLLVVGPVYGDSQVVYLYTIRRFEFTEVEYSVYGTINISLGLIGTLFCISVLSKKLNMQDSIIGVIAGTSRIAGCFMFAFAPTRQWFYVGPLLNIFSHIGLTAVRSLGTKSVPPEEVAKLSALIGVSEAIAPSIYMPASSYIYSSTIDTFPGAFYMFDAVLTLVALLFFGILYVLVKRRQKIMTSKKEDNASTNQVSRF